MSIQQKSTAKKKTFVANMNAELAAITAADFEKECGGVKSFAEYPPLFAIEELGPMNARLMKAAVFRRRCDLAFKNAHRKLEALAQAHMVAGEHGTPIEPFVVQARKDAMAAEAKENFAAANFVGEAMEAFPDAVGDGFVIGPEGTLGIMRLRQDDMVKTALMAALRGDGMLMDELFDSATNRDDPPFRFGPHND